MLGPGVKYHGDHFHLDLAHHNAAGTSRYCRPLPDGAAPRREPYQPGLIARVGALFDFNRTGSIKPAEAAGELLTDAPEDVIAREIRDPFGVYTMQAGED